MQTIDEQHLNDKFRRQIERLQSQHVGAIRSTEHAIYVVFGDIAMPVHDNYTVVLRDGQPIALTLDDDRFPARFVGIDNERPKMGPLPVADWPLPASELAFID